MPKRAIREVEGQHDVILAVAPTVGQAAAADAYRRAAHQESQEIDEMAASPMMRPPPCVGSCSPMGEWDEAGVDPVMSSQRFLAPFQECLQLPSQRGKAAVEADGEQRCKPCSAWIAVALDFIQLGIVNRQRLFAKDVLACRQRRRAWRACRWWRVRIATVLMSGF